eukprot:819934-Pelagomonas_calceolata.AAC.5
MAGSAELAQQALLGCFQRHCRKCVNEPVMMSACVISKVCFLVLWSSSFTLQCLFPDGSIPVFYSPCTIL